MLMMRRIVTTTMVIMMMMTMIRPCFADLQVLQVGPALRILCLGSPRKPNIYSWIMRSTKRNDACYVTGPVSPKRGGTGPVT